MSATALTAPEIHDAPQPPPDSAVPYSTGAMWALALAARLRGIAADAGMLGHQLGQDPRGAGAAEILRAARHLDLRARVFQDRDAAWLADAPRPLILRQRDGRFAVLRRMQGRDALIEPDSGVPRPLPPAELARLWGGEAILLRQNDDTPAQAETFGVNWFLAAMWRHRAALSHVLIAALFTQLFALTTPLLFQVLIDKVLVHRSHSTLVLIVSCLLVVALFDVVLQHLRTYALSHTSSRIDVELGAELFSRLMRLPLTYFETRAAGQTVARMREIETIRSFLTGQGLSSVIDCLFAVIFAAVLFAYSTTLGIIVLATLPLYLGITLGLRPLLRERIRQRFERNAQSQQFLVESVIGIATIKSAAIEPIVCRQWDQRFALYVQSAFRSVVLASIGQNAITFVTKLSTGLVIYYGAGEVIAGHLTVGGLVAFNMIAGQLTSPILRLSGLWQDFQQVQISAERIGDIFNQPPEQVAGTRMSPGRAAGAIAFRDVSFAYAPGLPSVLRGISLNIAPGEVIGIVGPSGSGKSTLAKLLQQLYLPTAGALEIDGWAIEDLSPAWLRPQIGVVPQENFLFNRTVHDNIALAAPAMPRQTVRQVAMLAGADEFIRRLPQGYDTMIEERGTNLSGGQRQRIAIARALARNPRVLIFDEATSALDYESERIIQANMRLMARGRTVIIIAHRLAAVCGCDRIIGLADGQIVETGTHRELLAHQGLYARLWSLQNAEEMA